ncbi:hypothetical protein OH77DRAFT_1524648 [Trametes cingulata]|nr:hypothetical protein OH77DRAFT_1524648 [Trametes cingulata]
MESERGSIQDDQRDVSGGDHQAFPAVQDAEAIPETPVPTATDDGADVGPEQDAVRDDDPDCMCWPHTKRSLLPTAALEDVLPPIRLEVEGAIEDLHGILVLLQEHLGTRAANGRLSPEIGSKGIASNWHRVSSHLDCAIARITEAPGYLIPELKCKNDYEQHFNHLIQRDKTLCNVEINFKKALEEAQPLFEAREKFLKIESEMRRRKTFNMAVRVASVLTLPFAPVLSGVLTALDCLVLSTYVGARELMVSQDELRTTSESVESLRKELNEKIAVVQKLRQELAVYKEKAEAQRGDPSARRLLDILTKIRTVKNLVDAISGSTTPDTREHPKQPSLREVVSAMRELADASGAELAAEDLLPSLDDAEWSSLDERLATFRSTLPSPQATS